MKKRIGVFWLPLALGAFIGLSCHFSNDAADEGADVDMQVAAGIIIETFERVQPVDAWACCFSRQANWGKINDDDYGAFNTWGDFRHPGYMIDGNLDTYWQTNYWTESVTDNPNPDAPSSGEQHHYINEWDSRHYVLLDLGSSREFNTIHFYQNRGSYVTAYEIYISDTWDDLANSHPDFPGDWNRNNVKLIQAHGGADGTDQYDRTIKPLNRTKVAEGQLAGDRYWQKIILPKTETARYVMFRSHRGAASSERIIDEIYLENWTISGFGGFDTGGALAAYQRAVTLLRVIDRDTIDYRELYLKVFRTMNSRDNTAVSFREFLMGFIADEEDIKQTTLLMQAEKQRQLDALVSEITQIMDRIDPPRKLPEVF